MKINIYIYIYEEDDENIGWDVVDIVILYSSIVYDIVLYLFIVMLYRRNENKQINMCI